MQNTVEKIRKITEKTNLKHIAIIMDGNRRWAKQKLLPISSGHKQGVEALKSTLKACNKFGIKYLTVYAFSTENWNRDKEEVDYLMSLLAKTIINEIPLFNENNIKLNFIGNKTELNEKLIEVLSYGEEQTRNNTGLNLQIAFNYGARAEITNALKEIAKKVQKGDLDIEDIDEKLISQNLYTKNIPDPDILIRTGGEKRISNYLLWQLAYTEIYVTNTYWPDFNEEMLKEAIMEFEKRDRRFGK